MKSFNANLMLAVWLVPTFIGASPLLTKSDQPVACVSYLGIPLEINDITDAILYRDSSAMPDAKDSVRTRSQKTNISYKLTKSRRNFISRRQHSLHIVSLHSTTKKSETYNRNSYDSQSAAEGAGWVFGSDPRATWLVLYLSCLVSHLIEIRFVRCGPDDSVNAYHDVINVQRNGNLPINHNVNCTASCSICGGYVHGCTVAGPDNQSQCYN